MEYRPFHCTRIGATHVRLGLPCQDASASAWICGKAVAVVADGHGSRRHFRSARGAELACDVALSEIERLLLNELHTGAEEKADVFLEEPLAMLKRAICGRWLDEVHADFRRNPWTPEELAQASELPSADEYDALEDGTDAAVAYGSTICAVIAGDDGWAAIQLGDGGLVRISPDGAYDWPMPSSMLNEGHRTASLCLADPLQDFRHCSGKDHPAGLVIFTDGVDKVLPPYGNQIVSLLHWIWNDARKNLPDEQGTSHTDGLCRTLELLTERARLGDDVSVAGIVDREAQDYEPHLSEEEQKRLRISQRIAAQERHDARIRELAGTLDYTKRRLVRLRLEKYALFGDPEGRRQMADAIASAEAVVARCADELRQLQADEG